tara:strand:- start:58372 stop:58848 length:477 start_codon:yes stop_codon:yes gene_type:complete
MYYITEKSSKTGEKITAMLIKARDAQEAAGKFVKRVGAEKYSASQFSAFGGVSAVYFKENPAPRLWKPVKDEEHLFRPKKNTKEGKAIAEQMAALPVVTKEELNGVVGFKSTAWQSIGLNTNNKTLYGITLKEEWRHQMPIDCREVTVSRYRLWFGKN